MTRAEKQLSYRLPAASTICAMASWGTAYSALMGSISAYISGFSCGGGGGGDDDGDGDGDGVDDESGEW